MQEFKFFFNRSKLIWNWGWVCVMKLALSWVRSSWVDRLLIVCEGSGMGCVVEVVAVNIGDGNFDRGDVRGKNGGFGEERMKYGGVLVDVVLTCWLWRLYVRWGEDGNEERIEKKVCLFVFFLFEFLWNCERGRSWKIGKKVERGKEIKQNWKLFFCENL